MLFGRRENHRAQQQQHSAWNGREHFCLFFLSLGENFFQEMEYETFLQPQKQKFEADSKIWFLGITQFKYILRQLNCMMLWVTYLAMLRSRTSFYFFTKKSFAGLATIVTYMKLFSKFLFLCQDREFKEKCPGARAFRNSIGLAQLSFCTKIGIVI